MSKVPSDKINLSTLDKAISCGLSAPSTWNSAPFSVLSVYSPSQETQNSIPRYIELTENHFNTNNRHWFNKMCRELGEHRYFSFFENQDHILSFLKNFMPHYSPNRIVNKMRKSFFKVERYLNEGTTTNEMFNEIYSSITSYGVKINEKAAQT